jgi:TPR repeat protein
MSCCLLACATPAPHIKSELADGKRYFNDGYYKRAMRTLLPLACDGNADAQYAVGYMYYYGLGVTQDTDVGYFWIKRSADKHNPQAINALRMITIPDRGK